MQITVPEGWHLTTQTGYPSLLARLSWGSGAAVITLALAKLAQPTSLPSLVAENNAALQSLGLRVTSSGRGQLMRFRGWIVDVKAAGGAIAIRQLYLPHGRYALIWTLTCPRAELTAAKLELERVLENLTLR